MVNQKHLNILKSGVNNWNNWKRENFVVSNKIEKPNLGGANLSGVELNRADLSRTNLRGANLKAADLSEADLSWADLSWADLSGAVLIGADLSSTNLIETNLSRCQVTNAKLDSALIGFTSFSNIDLTNVIGLDKCKHYSHSYIDYFTLSKSKKIPDSFLKGCGLSDDYINYLPSLYEQPLQFYYCFISYSSKDQEFAEILFSDLQNKGIRAWYAPHDLKAGIKIIEQIDKGIKVTDKLLLILSENSINSEWVKTEITKAQKKSEQIGKQVLFPISITKYNKLKEWEFYLEGKDMSQEIRDYYLLNFENWKDRDEYKNNFKKLVENLKITD